MLTRRNLLRFALGLAACFHLKVGEIARRELLGIANAEEPDQSSTLLETWMNEWMSVSKAPGGMLKISRFREPIYFLTAPISWTPNPALIASHVGNVHHRLRNTEWG